MILQPVPLCHSSLGPSLLAPCPFDEGWIPALTTSISDLTGYCNGLTENTLNCLGPFLKDLQGFGSAGIPAKPATQSV